MNGYIILGVMFAIGIINFILARRENKKTFTGLKDYLAAPGYPQKVAISNEIGWNAGRIEFIGGKVFFYNNVREYQVSILSMLGAAGIKDEDIEIVYYAHGGT